METVFFAGEIYDHSIGLCRPAKKYNNAQQSHGFESILTFYDPSEPQLWFPTPTQLLKGKLILDIKFQRRNLLRGGGAWIRGYGRVEAWQLSWLLPLGCLFPYHWSLLKFYDIIAGSISQHAVCWPLDKAGDSVRGESWKPWQRAHFWLFEGKAEDSKWKVSCHQRKQCVYLK